MRANGFSNSPATLSDSDNIPVIYTSAATLTNSKVLPSWKIDEKYVNKEDYSCVICMDTYVKNERVHGLPGCTHYFHSKCIQTWLLGKSECPLCRSKV